MTTIWAEENVICYKTVKNYFEWLDHIIILVQKKCNNMRPILYVSKHNYKLGDAREVGDGLCLKNCSDTLIIISVKNEF